MISLSGCASPSAGVVFGLNENVHTLSGFKITGLAGLIEVTQRGRRTKQLQLLGSARPMARARLFVRVAKVSCRGKRSTLCDAICLENLPGHM